MVGNDGTRWTRLLGLWLVTMVHLDTTTWSMVGNDGTRWTRLLGLWLVTMVHAGHDYLVYGW